jgi:hypothetical protein
MEKKWNSKAAPLPSKGTGTVEPVHAIHGKQMYLMEVSGHLHMPDALYTEGYNSRLGGPQGWSGCRV